MTIATPTLTAEAVTALMDELADRVAAKVIAGIPEAIHAPAPEWRLLDVAEVAARLGRSRRWVHQAIRERGLPYIRLDGGALAFDLEAVQGWAKARSIPRVDQSELLMPLDAPDG